MVERREKIADKTVLKNLPYENLHAVQEVFPPWSSEPNITFKANLNNPVKRSDPDEEKRNKTAQTLLELPAADIEVWSDGSAIDANTNGGGGVLVRYNAQDPVVDTPLSIPTGKVTSSFKSELLALHAGLVHVLENADWSTTKEIRCCTDSRSVVICLQTGPTFQQTDSGKKNWETIANILSNNGTHITLQWVPSHCVVTLNETADQLAKAGTQLQQMDVPIDYSTAKATIYKDMRAKWSRQLHADRHCSLSLKANWQKEQQLKRRHQIVLAQLRAGGKCPILKSYLHDIGAANNDICDRCNLDRDDLEHALLSCPAHERQRIQILGPQPTLETLHSNPTGVVAFLEAARRI